MPLSTISDILTNSTTANNQEAPSVTTLADGRYIVTWQSNEGATNGSDIRARIFSSTGVPAGDDFIVNTTRTETQLFADVTTLSDGRYVFTWESEIGGNTEIRGRIYNANGTPAGDDFPVNTTTANDQIASTVTALAGGRFVVAWQSDDAGATGHNIRAQIYGASGLKEGAEILVNTVTAGAQDIPDITTLADGRFVATWASFENQNTTGVEVRGRIFAANGTPAGADFVLNSGSAGDQQLPKIASLTGGRFVAVWQSSETSPIDVNIEARIFNANGTAFGADFTINSTTASNQKDPSVVGLADGRFMAVWSSLEGANDYEIRARVFDADGLAAGKDFTINSTKTGEQAFINVTLLQNGKVAVAWTSYEATGNANIRSTIVDPYYFKGEGGNDKWIGGSKGEKFTGSSGDDVFIGNGGNDTMEGGIGNDTLSGGSSKDVLRGGDGADKLDGGSSADTASYYYDGAVKMSLDSTYTANQQTGAAKGDTYISIANIQGSKSGSDKLIGNSGSNTIKGYGGNDVIYGRSGNDKLYGGSGKDTLRGGKGGDILDGGSGSDTVTYYYDGTVKMSLDTTYAASAQTGAAKGDTYKSIANIKGSKSGSDTLIGNSGANTISGYGGNDSLIGRDGNDKLYGSSGKDSLRGGAGADRLDGGSGSDTVTYYSDGKVKMSLDTTYAANSQTGAAKGDTYFSIANIKGSKSGSDTLIGNSGGNKISGYGGNDTLSGRDGNDRLSGGTGDDTLRGGLGADSLSGGDGKDAFRYKQASEGGDTISDFAAGDKFRFEGSAFGLGSYAGTLQASHFVARASGHAAKHAGDFIFDKSTDQLWFDDNGTAAGGATMIADMNDFNLVRGDILIV